MYIKTNIQIFKFLFFFPPRLKQELFLNKVKVEKVPTESSVSMDVT